MKKKVEVFTGSCRLCEGAVALVEQVVDPNEFDVEVLSIDGERAQELGLKAVPSIVLEGEVVFSRLPTREELVEAVR